MERRRFLQAMLATSAAVALEACAEKARLIFPPTDLSVPTERPVLRLATPSTGSGTFSPYAYGPYSLLINVYDTLVLKSPTGVFEPWLASRFDPSPDGLVYRFELRDDVRWHDGRPVTAEDVVFSFDYFNANQSVLPPTVLFRPTDVTAVKADGKGVTVHLSRPVTTFVAQVAGRFPIVPKHIWSGVDDPTKVTDLTMFVGSGPYRLESYDPKNEAYVFVANDDFFLGKPFVKTVEYHQVNDELIALRAEEIDAGETPLGLPTGQALPVFRRDPRFGVLAGEPDAFFALSWNLAKPGPTSDLVFRQACALAIDRERLVDRVLGSGQPGNPGLLARGHPLRVDVEQYQFDPDRANRLLDKAGYRRNGSGGIRDAPSGKKLRLKLLTFPQGASTAEIIKGDLERIGVQLEFEPSDFFLAISGGKLSNYEMALLFFAGAGASQNPNVLLRAFSSRTVGTGIFHSLGWKNAEYDELADSQEVTADEVERKRIVGRMQEIVAAELPMLILYYPVDYLIYNRTRFDQWSNQSEAKYVLVTGKNAGGTDIRPLKEA